MAKRHLRLERAVLKELCDEMDEGIGESLKREREEVAREINSYWDIEARNNAPLWPRITFGPDDGQRAKGMPDGGYMAVDTEYGLMEIRDGHVYLDGVDVGEVIVAAKDEADAKSAEILTKFLHWMSRTK